MAKRIFCLSVVFVLAGVILAQDKEPPVSTNPMTPKTLSAGDSPAPAAPVLRIQGEITAVSPANHTLTIKSGETLTVITWNEKTRMGRSGEERPVGELKVGQQVFVRYVEEQGKNIARRIAVNMNRERPILVRGAITALDTSAKTLTISNGSEKTNAIWDDQTKFVKDRQPATAEILALHKKIGLHYLQVDGKNVARRILLLEDKQSPAPAPAPAPEPK